jgi:hypothetical protein
MSRLRFALILLLGLLAVSLSLRSTATIDARVTSAAPAFQVATTIPAPTPASEAAPQTAAPVGEGTQQALLIVGLVVLSVLLIGGGIYLRQRWMATRY